MARMETDWKIEAKLFKLFNSHGLFYRFELGWHLLIFLSMFNDNVVHGLNAYN